MADTYWAKEPLDKIGGEILRQFEEYDAHLVSSGMWDIWKRVHNLYYAGHYNRASIGVSGEQGERRTVAINHFKNILQHIVVMTTTNRPALQPVASNSDHKSQSQTIISQGLLDYAMRVKHFEGIFTDAVTNATIYGEWATSVTWNPYKGADYMPDEAGQVVKTGDIEFDTFAPWDLARDRYLAVKDWYVVRKRVNRWDMMARYPQFAQVIEGLSYEDNRTRFDNDTHDNQSKDCVWMYTLWHEKTDALPAGRQVVCFDEDTVVFDGPLPYKSLPLYFIRPDERVGSAFGYAMSFDLAAIQEGVTMCESAMLTRANAGGICNVVQEKGTDIDMTQASAGLRVFEVMPGQKPPAVLDLLAINGDLVKYSQKLVGDMELTSGVNQVSRGNPPSADMSGAAMAFLQSMTIQFSSHLQNSAAMYLEQTGLAIINTYKQYARVPIVIEIAGKANRSYMRDFVGDDISMIDRVQVDVANPLMRTTAGRMQIADNLLQHGVIKEPEQYLSLIKTGILDPMTEGPMGELMRIRSENEALQRGETVQALATDNHRLDILEHVNILNSPEARADGQLVATVLQHVDEHINLLKTVDPALLMLLGQQPIAPPMPAAAPIPPPGVENPDGMPSMPSMPQMPTDPLTGQQMNASGPV
jgi:hypothetical protein